MNTLLALLVTAPEPLRTQLRNLSTAMLVDACMRLRPDTTSLHDPVQAAKHSLRCIAARARALDVEARALRKQLHALTARAAPATTAIFGLGPDTVSSSLITISDNFPDWVRAMDGRTVPYTWLAGYQVTVPAYSRHYRLPCLTWRARSRWCARISSV